MSGSLTPDDIDLLIEALEAWEKAEIAPSMIMTVIMASLGRTRAEKEELFQKGRTITDEAIDQKKSRTERSILVKAKLINWRDKLIAEMGQQIVNDEG